MRLVPVFAALLLVLAATPTAAIQVMGSFNAQPITDCTNSCGVRYAIGSGQIRFECEMQSGDYIGARSIRTCTRSPMTPVNYTLATGVIDLTCENGTEDLVLGASGFEEGGNPCQPGS